MPIGKRTILPHGRNPLGGEQFSAAPGAYGLVIRLDRPVRAKLGRRPLIDLAPGLYFYGGSARGPGGLRARLNRHARTPKPVHWHVDQLTAAGAIAGVWASKSAVECGLVSAVSGLGGAWVPAPGFGSSDCRACASHLVCLSPAHTVDDVFSALGDGITWRASSVY